MFTAEAYDAGSDARTGSIRTAHGACATPAFMPVGTRGTVKMLTPAQVSETGAGIILSNTYHLMLRPGSDVIRALGGLHTFSGWKGPILTDSGGFQVFSLARCNAVTSEGVRFNSHIDGAEIWLTPENVMNAQKDFGSDIAMVLDECPPADASYADVSDAVGRTLDWARTARRVTMDDDQHVFGIIQGGRFPDLRERCCRALVEMDFEGYALGGVSVGEERDVRNNVMKAAAALMPADRCRYVMGLGEPIDIFTAVSYGYDIFDCVIPTRNGRNGSAFTSNGPLNIRNSRFTSDPRPIEEDCDCYTCQNVSRGFIRHVCNVNEALGPMLLSIHNIRFFMRLMSCIRTAIENGTFMEWYDLFIDNYYKGDIS